MSFGNAGGSFNAIYGRFQAYFEDGRKCKERN